MFFPNDVGIMDSQYRNTISHEAGDDHLSDLTIQILKLYSLSCPNKFSYRLMLAPQGIKGRTKDFMGEHTLKVFIAYHMLPDKSPKGLLITLSIDGNQEKVFQVLPLPYGVIVVGLYFIGVSAYLFPVVDPPLCIEKSRVMGGVIYFYGSSAINTDEGSWG